VSDVERSKQFYQRLGWRLDAERRPGNKNIRIVQLTPPAQGARSVWSGITAAAPGSAVGALIVSDIKAAHDELIRRDIATSEMWHGASFPVEARLPGPDPKRASYGSFFGFADPDGTRGWSKRSQRAVRPLYGIWKRRRRNLYDEKNVVAAAANGAVSTSAAGMVCSREAKRPWLVRAAARAPESRSKASSPTGFSK